jgi:hypothetical protein
MASFAILLLLLSPVWDFQNAFAARHDAEVAEFVSRDGFGMVRMPPAPKPFRHAGARYSVGIELVRLERNEIYRYFKGEHPIRNLGGGRALTAAERSALVALRGGASIAFLPPGDGPRALGAVRATAACGKCHEAEEGELLGAFLYELVPER